ncbi:MAG: type VI secretion system-associated protein TagF [Alcanivorax sp.]|nr:type VI secretion system-associated protein TagF [Alcanivorax sp.]
MFGFLKQVRPDTDIEPAPQRAQIAAFGKLPIRADFIKLHVSEREIRELDQWVQEGYALLSRRLNGAQASEQFPRAGIHHAVFCATENQRAVLATLAPGHDQSGRWYPFVIATPLKTPFIKQVQAAVPVVYQPFFRHAHDIVSQRWKNEPLETLLGCLKNLGDNCGHSERSTMVEQELGLLRETSLTCMRELALQHSDSIAAFFQAVNELLGMVVRRGANRTQWGIRLPLPGGEAGLSILVFWLRLIDSLLGQNWTGNYFWRFGDHGHLVVFFRRVPPSFLPHLFDDELVDGTVQTLAAMMENPSSPSRKALDLAALEQGSLIDLLSRFVSGGVS